MTFAEPDVAFPVEKPPPVQEVAFVEDQVRVDGTVDGDAEKEQVRPPAIVVVGDVVAVANPSAYDVVV